MLTLAGWLSRHAWRALVSLVVIVLILIAGSKAVPWAKEEIRQSRELSTKTDTLAAARRSLGDLKRSVPDTAEMGRLGDRAVVTRRAELTRQRKQAEVRRLSNAGLVRAAATRNPDAIVAHTQAGVTLAAINAETAALVTIQAQREGKRARRFALAADARAKQLAERERALSGGLLAAQRTQLCRAFGTPEACSRVRALNAVQAELKEVRTERDKRVKALKHRQKALTGVRKAQAKLITAEQAADAARADLVARSEVLQQEARDNWWDWVSRPVRDVLPQALLILLGVILAPPAMKALLYFGVAPAAGRRAPVRLLPGARGVEGAGHVSAVTLSLPLTPGAELLVRPDFLQSSPDSATKRTRWLFDWGMPLTSLAAGLVGLTRVRGDDGRTVAVSAKDDPLAEVGRVDLPDGGGFVLQPRALIGLVQRTDAPMRLSRHWRLGVTAWLTLQLRYLVIHGPGTVLVAGTRGVRLEEAGAGRVSDQAGTLGFDAALAYSVTRSETFGAYLMGKAGLFDDRFRGDGRYLYEEMPRGRDGGSVWGRGLEGLGDAVLKVFGI